MPYGWHWRTVTRPQILRRAGGIFERGAYIGGARCERCQIPDAMPLSVWRRSEIEVAHLDGDLQNEDDANLAALCSGCHHAIDYRVWALQFYTWLHAERQRRIERADARRPLLELVRRAS
jgi:hypothetical protein